MITYYMDNGASLDSVGFMCHFDLSSLTGIPDLLRRLDRFAAIDEVVANLDSEDGTVQTGELMDAVGWWVSGDPV